MTILSGARGNVQKPRKPLKRNEEALPRINPPIVPPDAHDELGVLPESSSEKSPLNEAELKEVTSFFDRVARLLPQEVDAERAALPQRAFELALKSHGTQRRLSGEPFILHPLSVAELVVELIPDHATVAAALLHDVVEDTEISSDDLREQFGEEVAFLVDGVTNVSRIAFGASKEQYVDNMRRLLVATAKDLRVILIKLCDRLHNMRTLGALPFQKRRRICQVTLDVYAPLAHRLGVKRIKNQLEDLCMFHLYPHIYQQLKKQVDENIERRHSYAQNVQDVLMDVLATHGIEAQVEWRVKHFWSIFQKIRRDNKEIADIYDLTGIRILVKSIEECYAALGIVHGVWNHVQEKYRDYISSPKENDYRSIHTAVLGPEGRLLEIQIRTYDMHRVCEYGVAAHWRYKEKQGRSIRRLGADAAWISQLSGILQDVRDQEEWTSSLKTEVFADEIYCYTPKGDIIRLPSGSCPIDFAFYIHTSLGEHIQGAKVNGNYVPLSHGLQTGDVVEIETSKSAHPSPDWINIVGSSRARAKIKNYLFRANRETLIEQGKDILSRELQRFGKKPHIYFQSPECLELQEQFEVKTLEDLFALIGFGRITLKQITSRLEREATAAAAAKEAAIPDLLKKKKEQDRPSKDSMGISQLKDVPYRMARCCNPLPGDPIVGLSKNGSFNIHREDCARIRNVKKDTRLLNLEWDEMGDGTESKAQLEILANDRLQLLADITNTISGLGVDITSCKTLSHKNNIASLTFKVIAKDLRQLRRLSNLLREVEGVTKVKYKRVTN